MRAISIVLSFIVLTTPSGYSQSTKLSDWAHLVKAGKRDAALKLCSGYVDSPRVSEEVDAQKCLASVALLGHDIVMLQGEEGGGTLSVSGGYTKEVADQSLIHLNIALKLAPQDLSIHEGRLHVLEVSGRYSEMINALDQSCTIYKGTDAVDAWLAYAPELMDLGQYRVGLDFSKVLDKHYPNNPDVIGNIGAFLSLLGRDMEAISYLKRAVSLAPSDPINAWDLGREYDYANQNELADKWYQKGLSLETDKRILAGESCIYGKFVDKKLHNRQRACDLEKKNCAPKDQTACGNAKTPKQAAAIPAPKSQP